MKKYLILISSIIISTALTGCGATKSNQEIPKNQEISTTDENNLKTLTIQHSRGETTVPINPKKIAVFDFSILDDIDNLGIDVELALPTENIPNYLSKYSDAYDAGGIKEPDLEALFTFEPEIIFISGRQADYYEELSKIAPTIFVDLNAETYIEDVLNNLSYVSAIFEKSSDTKLLTDQINKRVEEVSSKAESIDEKALFIMLNNGNMSTYGKGSRFGIIFDALKVKAADETIEVSTHGQEVSYEYISEINPDILFVINRNSVVGGEETSKDELENDLIKSTNAYKNEKIIYLDSEVWYLAGGGVSSVNQMINEVESALQ